MKKYTLTLATTLAIIYGMVAFIELDLIWINKRIGDDIGRAFLFWLVVMGVFQSLPIYFLIRR